VQELALGLVEPHKVHRGPLPELVQVVMSGFTQHWACWQHMESVCLKGRKGFSHMTWWGSLRGLKTRFERGRGYNQDH